MLISVGLYVWWMVFGDVVDPVCPEELNYSDVSQRRPRECQV